MPFKDFLKKDKISKDREHVPAPELLQASQFTFVRTDTHNEEIIRPPAFDEDDAPNEGSPKRGLGQIRKGSNSSSNASLSVKEHKRLSHRLQIGSKSRASSTSSVNIPSDLPEIHHAYSQQGDREEKEAQWEERATILAREAPTVNIRPPTAAMSQISLTDGSTASGRPRSISDAKGDVDIQEAIRLHEAGELSAATEMFHTLAEQGNVLSQVLYGLSLRHGWGCEPDHTRAVAFLSAAASNSANIESEALKSGLKKGGAAKGELVLAIFELANCFRNGWGVPVDKVAARQYYETAANLGDTDAMNEAAWCYLEGFGGKKDKVSQDLFFLHPATNGFLLV